VSDRRDILVVGAGLGGLTAAALLAKRGLDVLVLERNDRPGGSCSAFRRRGVTLDLGAAMLFGFGERGFNPHRFVMNELEEEIDVYRHGAMYRLWYGDRAVVFWPETERFLLELDTLFPGSGGKLRALYRELETLYETLVSANSVFLSPSETPPAELARGFFKHPFNQAKLLGLMSKSALSIIKKYLDDERLLRFFDKLTSTYCYTTLAETPAVLAVTMFIENHVGGSYYPAGSPMMLSSKLEKALEKFGGSIRYRSTVSRILVDTYGSAGPHAVGVELITGERLYARDILYGGTVRNLYERLLPREAVPPALLEKVLSLEPSFPSSVLYGAVDARAIPADAFPVEMLIGNPDHIDENDVTLYISSLEDPSLAPPGLHSFMLIGPSAGTWPSPWSPEYQSESYRRAKLEEADRMLGLVEHRFPGFRGALEFSELGTPSTIERYLLKNGGAVAGPKACMGQELMNRQTARTFITGLWACGESTVMGTGTPAVTISGISAADVILRSRGLPEYRNHPTVRHYVHVIPHGRAGNRPKEGIFPAASRCQWCEDSPCSRVCPLHIDVMGIMRRLEADNIPGAARRLRETAAPGTCATCRDRPCRQACRRGEIDEALPIDTILSTLDRRADEIAQRVRASEST